MALLPGTLYVTIEPQDVETAESAFGLISADACATCEKPTPKTVSMDAVGWVAAPCPDEPEQAIARVGGYPLLCGYCPDCRPR